MSCSLPLGTCQNRDNHDASKDLFTKPQASFQAPLGSPAAKITMFCLALDCKTLIGAARRTPSSPVCTLSFKDPSACARGGILKDDVPWPCCGSRIPGAPEPLAPASLLSCPSRKVQFSLKNRSSKISS